METKNRTRKYWQSLEERTAPPAPVNEPEFGMSKNEMVAELKKKPVSRKGFLKFMGAGAVLVQAACRRPTEQIVPAVIRPPEDTPGLSNYYSSVAPDGTAIIVRTMSARPNKIAGNPEHPLSRGGVPAYQVASVMDLYDPDRLRRPVKLEKGKKKRTTRAAILSELKTEVAKGDYVLLTGPVDSPTSRRLINDFITANPGGKHVEFRPDPTYRQISEGQRASYGQAIVPYYRIDRADFIVTIDADFLGTMGLSSAHAAHFAERRDPETGKPAQLVAIESMFSLTGSNADMRIPVKPGDQTSVALSLAAHITLNLKVGPYSGNAQVRDLLQSYTPATVAEALNLDQTAIEKVAQQLWANRGRSLVMGGSPLAATGRQSTLAIAVNLLNDICGNDGITVDHRNALGVSSGISDPAMLSLLADCQAGKVKTLIVSGANIAYHLPASARVKEALQAVPYVASISDRIDETAIHGKAVLPLSHFLESWGDREVIDGIASIQQPTVRPIFDSASLEDYLIQLNDGLLGGAADYHSYLKNAWAGRAGGNFQRFWIDVLQKGFYAPRANALNERAPARNFNVASLNNLPRSVESQDGLRLGLYMGIAMQDGSIGNNAYRLELPDPVTKIVWENYVAILPATARKLKLKQGSIVNVKVGEKSIQLPVHMQPGLHPDAALVALGYGRTATGKVGNNRGQNAIALATTGDDSLTLSGQAVTLDNTGDRKNLGNTQTVYRSGMNEPDNFPGISDDIPYAPFAGSTQYAKEDRPIILESSYADYQKATDKLFKYTVKHPDNAGLMETWDYENLRWHMVVDLSKCSGCGACVTSCNLENNIPMVGPEEVAVGREMHWLRIDRYYAGSEENPTVSHQPMMCQQCENAPCENVCPVAATTHNSEGLNVMTYNRCVGTRYCANNCPYKVRRFNWFENWYYMEGLDRKLRDPMQLGLNPDVTVRTRGVMEKCTFCVQRINAARQDMKVRGDKRMKDGTVVTACQEVCPSGAITFGDVNDESSAVYQLAKKDKRSYRVLDFLGVAPSITYLARIRDPMA
jgi:Fe-S-cluster-containing dehydrogenase component/anaerobic selenocysteine-containing dehydrogenase